MYDKNLHIAHLADGHYPIPEINPDDAWAAMEKILDENQPKTAGANFFKKFWWLCLLLLFVTGTWTYIENKRHPGIISQNKKIEITDGNKEDNKNNAVKLRSKESTHQFANNNSASTNTKKTTSSGQNDTLTATHKNYDDNKKDMGGNPTSTTSLAAVAKMDKTRRDNLPANNAGVKDERSNRVTKNEFAFKPKYKLLSKKKINHLVDSLAGNDQPSTSPGENHKKNTPSSKQNNTIHTAATNELAESGVNNNLIATRTTTKNSSGKTQPGQLGKSKKTTSLFKINDALAPQTPGENNSSYSKKFWHKQSRSQSAFSITKSSSSGNLTESVAASNKVTTEARTRIKLDNSEVYTSDDSTDVMPQKYNHTLEITSIDPVQLINLDESKKVELQPKPFTPLVNTILNREKSSTVSGKKNSFVLNFGVQWNIPLPLQGSTYYFTGANAKSQPFNLMIPAIWAGKSFGKSNRHQIQLLLTPYQQFFTGKKQVDAQKVRLSPTDTTPAIKTTALLKSSGFGASLQYNYRIGSKWSAGFGVQYYKNTKALFHQQTTRVFNNQLVADTLFTASHASAEWQYLKNSILIFKPELLYSFNKFHVGASLSIPLSNLSANTAIRIQTLNGQLFIRWQFK